MRRSRACPKSLTPYLGARTAEIVAVYRKAQPKLTADEIAIAIVSDLGIRAPSLLIAERKLAQEAAPVFVYLFAWETPVLGGRLRSCHTLEIPFVFSNLESAELTGDDPGASAAGRDHEPGLDRLSRRAAIRAMPGCRYGRPIDRACAPR